MSLSHSTAFHSPFLPSFFPSFHSPTSLLISQLLAWCEALLLAHDIVRIERFTFIFTFVNCFPARSLLNISNRTMYSVAELTRFLPQHAVPYVNKARLDCITIYTTHLYLVIVALLADPFLDACARDRTPSTLPSLASKILNTCSSEERKESQWDV